MNEKSPLMEARSPEERSSALRRVMVSVAAFLLIAATVLVVARSAQGVPAKGGPTELVDVPNFKKSDVKKTLLYQDWRGMSLEEKDAFTFSHTWTGEILVDNAEEHIVQPPKLKILQGKSAPDTAAAGVLGPGGKSAPPQAQAPIGSNAKSLASKLYHVDMDGDWTADEALALLETYQKVCGKKPADVHKGCDLKHTVWTIAPKAKIIDDVAVSGEKVVVSKLAFANARMRDAEFDGTKGKLHSKRLQHAVMRVVTNFGNKPRVADYLLNRMFGTTLTATPGMTKLTQDTTIEDGARFMKFKPRELMLALEAWNDMPKHMHKATGLRYLTRRQQGLNHPVRLLCVCLCVCGCVFVCECECVSVQSRD
jgi:hypothetical protein